MDKSRKSAALHQTSLHQVHNLLPRRVKETGLSTKNKENEYVESTITINRLHPSQSSKQPVGILASFSTSLIYPKNEFSTIHLHLQTISNIQINHQRVLCKSVQHAHL